MTFSIAFFYQGLKLEFQESKNSSMYEGFKIKILNILKNLAAEFWVCSNQHFPDHGEERNNHVHTVSLRLNFPHLCI